MSNKKKLANTETDRDVSEFLSEVKNKQRREDAFALLEMMTDITKQEARVWGVSIVGFGKYKYQRKNGQAYEWFHVGFSPAANHLTVYLMYDISQESKLLEQLGPHRCGKGCLYIKRLSDVHLPTLKKMIAKSDRWER